MILSQAKAEQVLNGYYEQVDQALMDYGCAAGPELATLQNVLQHRLGYEKLCPCSPDRAA